MPLFPLNDPRNSVRTNTTWDQVKKYLENLVNIGAFKGDKGDKGDTGAKGDQGIQGVQGLKGDQGDQGIQGPIGLKGNTGPTGLKGDKGDKGDTGDTGPIGVTGAKGDQGIQGPQGIQGEIGLTGPRGEKGDKGDTGAQGIQGIPGKDGSVGPKGDKGDTGPQGQKGDTGLQGSTGLQGAKGDLGRGVASITAEGSAATVTYTDGTTSPLPLPTTAPAVGVGVRAALAERAERRVRVVSIGDSHTEPVGASSHFNGWAALVARDIGGEGGSTIHITPDTTAAVSSTAIEWNAVNHHAAELIWGHSEVTWSGLDGVDAVGVVYLHVGSEEAPDYTRPLVSINGAAASDAYSSTDVLYTPGTSYRVSWVSGWPGNGSLTIRTPEPAKAFVFGILARRDSASSGWDTGTGQGVSWINWSRSGWSSRTWADNLDQWVITEPMRALPPDVLHIGLGANDAVQGVPPSEIEANIAAIITHVRDYAPSVPVIATLSPWCDVHTTVTEAAWADSLNAVASAVEAAGGSVIDLRQIGPESLYPGLWLPGENHFAPPGHRLIADLVGRALT